MSRYIRIDEAKERTTQLFHGYEVEQWLETLPSIDIVRCAECKHWSKYRTDGNLSYCELLCGYCDGNEYCAWGERQTDKPTHGYMWTCPNCGLGVHSDFTRCPCCGYERQTERSE